jgi:hypothetical protein
MIENIYLIRRRIILNTKLKTNILKGIKFIRERTERNAIKFCKKILELNIYFMKNLPN